MKTSRPKAPTRQAAVVLLALASAMAASAATPLNGLIRLRPLTSSEQSLYGLSSLERASGLSTVPIGQPVYLDALVNVAINPADIQSVTWTVTSTPLGSAATNTAPSPLGTNVPLYAPSDQVSSQLAGRASFVPDVRGQYTLQATIVTGASGSTNITQTLVAGLYVGASKCELCHLGGVAPPMYPLWTNTLHASMFARSIDGQAGYSKNCIQCHTVGYDTAPLANNHGFDDMARTNGWTFPSVITNGNWASMCANYPDVANMANIQCENCHGPGSEHAYSLGDPTQISVTFKEADCGQCHDAITHHVKTAEWKNSKHAITTTIPTGPNRNNCVRCHTPAGFKGYIQNIGNTNGYVTNTTYEAMSCQGCHDPHDATNPHQLRASTNSITLSCGVTVTDAGFGTFCMNCHQSRTGSVTNSLVNYPLGLPTWANGSSFGPHDSPVADMIEGVNGYEYGKSIPSSAHRYSVQDTCVGCHMQPGPTSGSDPFFAKVGGHSMNMSSTQVAAGVTNTLSLTAACAQCHGPIDTFDMLKEDYNGDGVIEGVQTEVQHLLDKLSTMLPNRTYRADGNYQPAGVVQTSVSPQTNWPARYLQGAWNWQFVNNDKSLGVHNAPYAVGLLKASVGDLSGDSNNDGLPDSWQIQYFGSANDPKAAPNASPAGDGVPNWLKWSLGLDPWVPGISIPGGVVWANGKDLVNPPIDPNATNTIAIYTAAEIVFNSEAGKNYQIQAISQVGDGWQPLGTNYIAGTGSPISYVTPTRANAQQFYRVVQLP